MVAGIKALWSGYNINNGCAMRVDFGNIECAALLGSHIVYLELMVIGWV